MAKQAQRSADTLLRVFAMFKFTPKQVIKIGSLVHLVEMVGGSEGDVPEALESLTKEGLIVKGSDSDFSLTELGCQRIRELGS